MLLRMSDMIMSTTEESLVATTNESSFLAALIGSRICHDLANPIGAISNGVELLNMGGAVPGGPEMGLVSDSVAHASAKLRFTRISFGVANHGQMLGRSETELVLADCYAGGRLHVVWGVNSDQPRTSVKLAFLLIQCVESALPRGGEIHVSETDGRWRIEGSGDTVKIEHRLWDLLDGKQIPTSLRPADVQFALAPRSIAGSGHKIEYTASANKISLTF